MSIHIKVFVIMPNTLDKCQNSGSLSYDKSYYHHCFFKGRNKIGAAFGINDAFIAAQIAYQKFLREVAR